MSSTKSGGRPRSWFGIKLGGRKQDKTETSAKLSKDKTEMSLGKDGGKNTKISPKKDKQPMSSKSSKSNRKPKTQGATQGAGESDISVQVVDREKGIKHSEKCIENMVSSESVRTVFSPGPLGNPSIGSDHHLHRPDVGCGESLSEVYRLQSSRLNKKTQAENGTPSSTEVLSGGSNKTTVSQGGVQQNAGDFMERSCSSSPAVSIERHLQQQQLQEQQLQKQQVSAVYNHQKTHKNSASISAQTSHSANTKIPSSTGASTTDAQFKAASFSSSSSSSSTAAKTTSPTPSSNTATTIKTSTTTSASSSTPTVKIAPTPRYNLNFLGDLQSKHKFSLAVCKQNDVANSAIQSLGSLNEQIVQYILSAYTTSPDPSTPSPLPSPASTPTPGDPPKDGSTQPGRVPSIADRSQAISSANLNLSSPAAHASMVIIRRLLVDAQTRFRRMVDDNRQLAAHIDSSIQAANQEVFLLRAELASTNRKLSQMNPDEMARVHVATQVDPSLTKAKDDVEKETSYREDAEALMKANQQLVEEYRHLLEDHKSLSLTSDELKVDNERLLGECSRLQAQLHSLSMDYDVMVKEVKAEVSPGQQRQSSDQVDQEGQGSQGEGQPDDASMPKNSDGSTGDDATSKVKPPVAPRPSYGELKLELIQSRQELNRAKEMLHGMKCDRKRLKGEKLDLLGQIKQLYTTLEDKETELRDFIKNYEQRVKESDEMIKQLAKEKAKAERDKWDIVTRAKDASERAVLLKAQLDAKDAQLLELAKEKAKAERDKWDIVTRAKDASERAVLLKAQLDAKDAQLLEARKQLSSHENEPAADGATTKKTNASKSDNSAIIDEGEDDIFISVDDNGFSTLEESSVLNCTLAGEGSDSVTQASPCSPGSNTSGSTSPSGQQFRWFTQSSDLDLALGDSACSEAGGGGGGVQGGKGDTEGGGGGGLLGVGKSSRGGSKKKKTNGIGESLSRVFSRGKMRRSVALPHAEAILGDSGPKLSVLSQDNYQEKLATIEKMVGVHMREWRAHQVLAWLEITLAMPMYAQSCLSNVKSGKILLGLSDSELSAAMGVTNAMHRRKLRLAIEQHRNPDDINYIKASEMDPTWVSHRLLPDLGLPQYTQVFEDQLCDGHVLNTLTRRDLEKHFSVHRKFHQSSILHAVELMRRIDFNKEKLYHRRNLSEDKDNDLIVWTNERLIKWLRSIDLGEYSEALLESGVHGALMVLEPSFNTDSLAAILGIPPSKSYITRHLSSELDKILKPARAALDPCDHQDVTMRAKGSVSPAVKPSASSGKLWQEKDAKPAGQEAEKPRGGGAGRLERRKSQEEGRSRLSFRGSIGRAFGKKIGNELRLNKVDKSSKPRISAPVPLVVSSESVSRKSIEMAGLVQKGFCVKQPVTFQRTRSLIINVDRSGRVTGHTNEDKDYKSRTKTNAKSSGVHPDIRRPKSCSGNVDCKKEQLSVDRKASESKSIAADQTFTFSSPVNQETGIPKTKVPRLKTRTPSGNGSSKALPSSTNSTNAEKNHRGSKTNVGLSKTEQTVSKQSSKSVHSLDSKTNKLAGEFHAIISSDDQSEHRVGNKEDNRSASTEDGRVSAEASDAPSKHRTSENMDRVSTSLQDTQSERGVTIESGFSARPHNRNTESKNSTAKDQEPATQPSRTKPEVADIEQAGCETRSNVKAEETFAKTTSV
ncbi:kazrin-like [Elysia marginata]|uniref:Kazrin-like n=1 Tax=Elysia marginata TaxID=1093978 RepID=A0AAV4J537_9GAST|nr:kazrin-like [Elysia marginata]